MLALCAVNVASRKFLLKVLCSTQKRSVLRPDWERPSHSQYHYSELHIDRPISTSLELEYLFTAGALSELLLRPTRVE